MADNTQTITSQAQGKVDAEGNPTIKFDDRVTVYLTAAGAKYHGGAKKATGKERSLHPTQAADWIARGLAAKTEQEARNAKPVDTTTDDLLGGGTTTTTGAESTTGAAVTGAGARSGK